eukprot:290095-Rhodomonas_salina.1
MKCAAQRGRRTRPCAFLSYFGWKVSTPGAKRERAHRDGPPAPQGMPCVSFQNVLVLWHLQLHKALLQSLSEAIVRHEAAARRRRPKPSVQTPRSSRFANQWVRHPDPAVEQSQQVSLHCSPDSDPRFRHPRQWHLVTMVLRVILLRRHVQPH